MIRRAQKKTQIPDDIEFRTKPQISLELVNRAKANGIRIMAWTADELYGGNSEFLAGLDACDEAFVETSLIGRNLLRLPCGSVVMGDAGFGIFYVAHQIATTGHGFVLRMTKQRFASLTNKAELIESDEHRKVQHYRDSEIKFALTKSSLIVTPRPGPSGTVMRPSIAWTFSCVNS